MTDGRVSLLRKRLGELGLSVGPSASTPNNDFYDEPLAAVVKSYQETKGLTVDGVIGTNTTRSLNTSLDDRIEQIVANLEHQRWLPGTSAAATCWSMPATTRWCSSMAASACSRAS